MQMQIRTQLEEIFFAIWRFPVPRLRRKYAPFSALQVGVRQRLALSVCDLIHVSLTRFFLSKLRKGALVFRAVDRLEAPVFQAVSSVVLVFALVQQNSDNAFRDF